MKISFGSSLNSRWFQLFKCIRCKVHLIVALMNQPCLLTYLRRCLFHLYSINPIHKVGQYNYRLYQPNFNFNFMQVLTFLVSWCFNQLLTTFYHYFTLYTAFIPTSQDQHSSYGLLDPSSSQDPELSSVGSLSNSPEPPPNSIASTLASDEDSHITTTVQSPLATSTPRQCPLGVQAPSKAGPPVAQTRSPLRPSPPVARTRSPLQPSLPVVQTRSPLRPSLPVAQTRSPLQPSPPVVLTKSPLQPSLSVLPTRSPLRPSPPVVLTRSPLQSSPPQTRSSLPGPVSSCQSLFALKTVDRDICKTLKRPRCKETRGKGKMI